MDAILGIVALLVGLLLGLATTGVVLAFVVVRAAASRPSWSDPLQYVDPTRVAREDEQRRMDALASASPGGRGDAHDDGVLPHPLPQPKTRQKARCAFCEGVRRALGLRGRDLVVK